MAVVLLRNPKKIGERKKSTTEEALQIPGASEWIRALEATPQWSFWFSLTQRRSFSVHCALPCCSLLESLLQRRIAWETPSATTTREDTSIQGKLFVCQCLTIPCTSAKLRVSLLSDHWLILHKALSLVYFFCTTSVQQQTAGASIMLTLETAAKCHVFWL